MLRNFILDWSGTLVDDLGPVAAATNLIFRHFGKPEILLEEFRERFRLPFDSFYQEYLPDVALVEIEPLFHSHFNSQENAVVLLPHALEFLRFCQATRRRVFVLSATKEIHVANQASRLGLDPYFERLYAGVMDKRERIKQILEDNFLAPNETAFIGDMVHDIETARHGGVKAIATLTGYDSAEKLSRAQPEVTVRDLGELQSLLEAQSAADEIRIEELEIFTRIGVPDEERATPQRLLVSLTLQTFRSFGEIKIILHGPSITRRLRRTAKIRSRSGGAIDRDPRRRDGAASDRSVCNRAGGNRTPKICSPGDQICCRPSSARFFSESLGGRQFRGGQGVTPSVGAVRTEPREEETELFV